MVFVKVRETYDLHTLPNKMTVIGVHTPKAEIIKRNYPGLLMNCKMYRPVSCDIRLACASMLPLDPQGVGITEGDVAPEDVFNPILYKAVSNKSMSQIEQYINRNNDAGWTVRGDSLDSTADGVMPNGDDFDLYYGLLANTHDWKHANPQSGLSMNKVTPLVYEVLYNIGDNREGNNTNASGPYGINPDGTASGIAQTFFKGKAHPMPLMNCTTPFLDSGSLVTKVVGFPRDAEMPFNAQCGIPAPKVMCACLCIPPSRLHQLFYRMVVEWTLEFVGLRPLSEISTFAGVAIVGSFQHVMDYDFGESKMLTEGTDLVDTTEGSAIHKVM